MLLKKLGSFLLETIQVVVFAISIFLFVYLLVLQPHKIKGASMEPSFFDSEYLLTDKITYRLDEPQRGDVIVFKAPPTFRDEFIKRIIGLPGDRITIIDGAVFVNQKKLSETYISKNEITNPGKFIKEGQEIDIPADSYFVMGDNRNHSLDSRNFGFVTKDKITGRAWLVYWPPPETGIISPPVFQ